MQLFTESVPLWLLSLGHLPPDAIVRGNLIVEPVERRNRGFRVQADNDGIFVKQIRNPTEELTQSSQREAAWYRSIAGSAESSRSPFDELRPLTPRFIDYDRARFALLIELLPGAEDLSRVHARSPGSFPTECAALLGEALAALHRIPAACVPDPSAAQQGPAALQVHHSTGDNLVPENPITRQLHELLASQPGAVRILDELSQRWQPICAVHGDLRWENVLLSSEADGKGRLHVIDWELVAAGDPLWDAGGVLESYLRSALASSDNAMTGPDPAVLPAIREFWSTYASSCRIPYAIESSMARVAVQYAAARFIQSSFEIAAAVDASTEWCIFLLQTGLQLLQSPETVSSELSGWSACSATSMLSDCATS